jgi:hypothetical protein
LCQVRFYILLELWKKTLKNGLINFVVDKCDVRHAYWGMHTFTNNVCFHSSYNKGVFLRDLTKFHLQAWSLLLCHNKWNFMWGWFSIYIFPIHVTSSLKKFNNMTILLCMGKIHIYIEFHSNAYLLGGTYMTTKFQTWIHYMFGLNLRFN